MKTLKSFTLVAAFMLLINVADAQNKTAAVLDIPTSNLHIKPEMAGNLIRIEMQKIGHFKLLDKFDVEDILKKAGKSSQMCYGKDCLIDVGKTLEVDKMISGNFQQFGKKIVIELKIIDVATGQIEAKEVTEYINLEAELQTMVMISINNMIGIENDPHIMNNLIYYNNPAVTPTTKSVNNGMRMGLTYISGDKGQRLQDPIEDGGYDSYPVISQFGYQHEVQYLSAGNLQALGEGLFMIGGLEQQMFIPSFVLMNGFRHKEKGWEVAFGPSFSLTRRAYGFYDTEGVLGEANAWHLQNDWNNVALGDTSGVPVANPYTIVERMDKRGAVKLATSWVWAIGKTFRSGYLNIPVNLYASPNRNGWHYGLSVGFNVRKKDNAATYIVQ